MIPTEYESSRPMIERIERDSEQLERIAVVNEAMTWLRTPFRHEARVKGAGVDCAQILIGVYSAAGIIGEFNPNHYSHQWHMNRSEEKYLATIQNFAHEIAGPPQPGDVAIWKFARCFSHAAIVIDWPNVIHAYVHLGVCLCDISKDTQFTNRPVKFFSAW